jgi:hypothetical protein
LFESIGLMASNLVGFMKKVLRPRFKSVTKLLVLRAVNRLAAPSVVSLQFSQTNYLILAPFSERASLSGARASSPIVLLLKSSLTIFLFYFKYLVIRVMAAIPSRLLFERLRETRLHSSVRAGTRAFSPWFPILLSEILRIERILLFCSSLHKSLQACRPNLFL